MDNLPYTLTVNELWLLLSQYGPAYVLGMENPYLGWLADEIESAHHQAVDSLLARGLARPLTDETIDVDDQLLAMAEACVHPIHSVVLQVSQANGQGEQRYIHFTDGLIVDHQVTGLDQHVLSSYASRTALLESMSTIFRLNSGTRGRGSAFQLPETALYQAAELAASGRPDEISVVLKEAGLQKPDIEALQAALTHPVANVSLAVIANQGNPDTQHVRGFGILESEADLWLLCPFDQLGQPKVEFIPIDAAGIRQRLEETLPASAPEKEAA